MGKISDFKQQGISIWRYETVCIVIVYEAYGFPKVMELIPYGNSEIGAYIWSILLKLFKAFV